MARHRLAEAAAAAAVLAGLGACAAGCGGRAAPASATTTATTTGARAIPAALRAYQSCLKAHGVTITFRGPGGRKAAPPPSTTSTTPRRAFRGTFADLTAAQRKAAQACRSKLPAGGFFRRSGPGGGGPAGGAFAKYTACLSRHGIRFGATTRSAAAFRKAQAACRSLLPG